MSSETLNDALSNQFKNAEEYAHHLEQTTNFMENQIVWESRQEDRKRLVPRPLIFFRPQRNPNKPPRYLYNKDLFFLKHGNTKEKKYVLLLLKILAERFLEVDLEETNESLGIEKYEPYSIVDKPCTSLIYLNSKEEKQVMYLIEIVKFCDARLEKVLKEVKLKIFQSEPWRKSPLLGELDHGILRAFEREINK
ncbi:hypothetical protein Tco_0172826 [Tanacetum coccineum]